MISSRENRGGSMSKPTFYEFFAGGGMARAGLGTEWRCTFANDFDFKKAVTYQANWGSSGEMQVGDIRRVKLADLPGVADLAWGSFPCQDLSLAGGGAGLKGERSGTFYPFWEIVTDLAKEDRAPRVIALENVTGALTSHGGRDFAAICDTFRGAGYRFGAVVIDAALFIPQSRPRLFVVGIREDVEIDERLTAPGPILPFHTRGLQNAYDRVSKASQAAWVWWNLPTPASKNNVFADLIEESPASVEWHTAEETRQLLRSMTPINLAKVDAAKRSGRRMVGTVYKRTREDDDGRSVKAEVRFDDVAGCLRTPSGGSSRQTIIVVDGEHIRTRLISARETARLMGLPDEYKLPKAYNEAYHLTGDGVAVPVVRHLAKHLFEPLLGIQLKERVAA